MLSCRTYDHLALVADKEEGEGESAKIRKGKHWAKKMEYKIARIFFAYFWSIIALLRPKAPQLSQVTKNIE